MSVGGAGTTHAGRVKLIMVKSEIVPEGDFPDVNARIQSDVPLLPLLYCLECCLD